MSAKAVCTIMMLAVVIGVACDIWHALLQRPIEDAGKAGQYARAARLGKLERAVEVTEIVAVIVEAIMLGYIWVRL